MDIKTLRDTPPWEWPTGAGQIFRKILVDKRADQSDRLIAAELAGDLVVMNDNMANTLLAVAGDAGEPEQLRAQAVISFGPALEQADLDEFDDDAPITERTFRKIQDSLQKMYRDNRTPKKLRRRTLEASVRAAQPWHHDAITDAYSSGDREWMLTAVFAMRYVRGFDNQIVEALQSGDPEIHYEAVQAAGNWGLDAAWDHVVDLVNDPHPPKELLLAAISAVATIRPAEAGMILVDLTDSEDEEIAEAASDAMMEAEAASHEEDEEDEEDGEEDEWVN